MTKIIEALDKISIAYEESLRRSGRTTRIAQKTQDTGAIMVCHNSAHANQVAKYFDIKTVSLETYLRLDYNRGSKSVKHIFDHLVEFVLIQQKLKEVERILNESLDTDYSRF